MGILKQLKLFYSKHTEYLCITMRVPSGNAELQLGRVDKQRASAVDSEYRYAELERLKRGVGMI